MKYKHRLSNKTNPPKLDYMSEDSYHWSKILYQDLFELNMDTRLPHIMVFIIEDELGRVYEFDYDESETRLVSRCVMDAYVRAGF